MTYFARHIYIRQEIHFDGLVAVALTFVASSTLYVKGEACRLVASNLRLRKSYEEGSDIGEDSGVGGRIASRRSAYRTLVNIHHLVYQVDALDAVVWHRLLQAAIEMLRENRLQGLVDQG